MNIGPFQIVRVQRHGMKSRINWRTLRIELYPRGLSWAIRFRSPS